MLGITIKETDNRRSRLSKALLFSVALHALWLGWLWIAPVVSTAVGLRHIEFVDEDYDHAILVQFSKKPLAYPPGYAGFHAPEQTTERERAEARRKAAAERRRRLEAERRAREREEAEQRAANERAQAELAQQQPKPTPTPHPDGYGTFGKINTAPIKDQIQKLYEAKKAGTLVFDGDRLRVGVTGKIKADGTLSDYHFIQRSGNPEIDRAATVILDAISDSHAVGPLHELTSLSINLDIDQEAKLTIVGFTADEQSAASIVNLVQAALLVARLKKSDDPAVMTILKNLKVSRQGQRVQASIIMPRDAASATLTSTMEKGKTEPPLNRFDQTSF